MGTVIQLKNKNLSMKAHYSQTAPDSADLILSRSALPFTFNQEVTEVFEDMIDRSVPGYKTSLSLIAHNARRYYQSNTNCYDVGCSLGASSLSILQGAKDAKVTAIDNSEAMIEECERRFKNLTESFHIKFICEDIMDSSLSDASIVVVNYVIQLTVYYL